MAPIWNKGCDQVQRWNSLLQKLGVERVQSDYIFFHLDDHSRLLLDETDYSLIHRFCGQALKLLVQDECGS